MDKQQYLAARRACNLLDALTDHALAHYRYSDAVRYARMKGRVWVSMYPSKVAPQS